jgi:cyclic beta-1,2-glucan synthetase
LWTALLALLPASEVAIVLVQRMVSSMVTPRRLPRLDLGGGVPESATTMVIVPTILSSVSATGLLDRLQVQMIGNLEGNVYFAVLAIFGPGHRTCRRQSVLTAAAKASRH